TPSATLPTGDACPGVTVVPDAPAVAVPYASLAMGSDLGTSRGSRSSTSTLYRDAVYQFALAEARDVLISASRPGTASLYLEVQGSCGSRRSTGRARGRT